KTIGNANFNALEATATARNCSCLPVQWRWLPTRCNWRYQSFFAGCHPVWSKISNVLKRLGFRSRNFFAQLLSETSRACTIWVRQSSLGRLWNDLGSHACLHHRNRRPGTTTQERISGRREPHPESPNQRQVVVIRCRKSYVG